MTTSLYDVLFPTWMDYQWAIRDYNKLSVFGDGFIIGGDPLGDARDAAFDNMMLCYNRWAEKCREHCGPGVLVEWENPDGMIHEARACTIQGVMYFPVY